MNKEEIIQMAIEHTISGLKFDEDGLVRFAQLVAQHEEKRLTDAAMKAIAVAIETAMALEREACAKVCEDSVEYAGDTLADAIRARGQA